MNTNLKLVPTSGTPTAGEGQRMKDTPADPLGTMGPLSVLQYRVGQQKMSLGRGDRDFNLLEIGGGWYPREHSNGDMPVAALTWVFNEYSTQGRSLLQDGWKAEMQRRASSRL